MSDTTTIPEQVHRTNAATALMEQLEAKHGPLMFHQSGGCCDGSSPMCYPRGEFLVGDQDVLLGTLGETPFYISRPTVRILEAHGTHAGRRARARRHVLAGQRRGCSVSHPVASVHR